jgi:hypothetical protein
MALSRLACLVPLFAAACWDDGPSAAHSLAQVDGLELQVSIDSKADEAIVEVRIFGRETCLEFDDSFVVRANGWTSDPTRDWVYRGDEDDITCAEPFVRMSVPEAYRTGGALEVLDRTRRVTLPIGDELQRRTARWVTPADGVLRSGAPLEIEWSRPADLARDGYFSGTVEGEPNGRFPMLTGPVHLEGTVPTLSSTVDTEVTVRVATRTPLRWEVAPGEAWTVKVDTSTAIPARTAL